MSEKPFDVLVTDLRMPGMSGIALLKALAETNLDIVPIVITGDGTIPDAVEAVKLGAFDFIEKPQGVERLESTVDRAYRHKHLRRYAATMAETALHWETTFDAVPDLISIVDTEGRLVRVNKAMADRVGLAPREAVGRPYEEVLGGAGSAGVRSPHTANADELSRIYSDVFGAAFLVTTSPLVSAQGETMGAVHVARDVNDARKAEIQLREAHEETEGLLASMSYFLIGLDADCRVNRWNAAAQETFGIAPEDATGKEFRWCGIRWDWEMMEDALPQCATSGRAVKLPDIRYTKPDHSEGILDVTINPVWTASGDAKGISLIGNDVTARKNLETQLLHAQKLESIGHLASGIAHEINTPIQYIGDNIRFLQDSFRDLFTLVEEFTRLTEAAASAEFERKILDSIQDVSETIDLPYLIEQIPKAIGDSLDGVERVASIVLAMKEFSHPGGAEKTPVNLNRAIESTITVARNEWKYLADVDANFESDAPAVSCLPGEFNQVILNILINAAHAIGDVVGDGSNGKGKITVVTRSDHDWFEVRISDTGAGIPEKIRSRIFDPFFTTKDVGRGTGQGLAIAHNVIVEKHRGTLTFETKAGKGTTFIIRIPIDG
jgi:PAS domain S-box-containing protein